MFDGFHNKDKSFIPLGPHAVITNSKFNFLNFKA